MQSAPSNLLLQWVNDVAEAGGKSYTFHIEATGPGRTTPSSIPTERLRAYFNTEKALPVIDQIHAAGMRCGVAVSPQTPSTAITDEIGEKADMLLVMTVHPGAGGQKFMEECIPKVSKSCDSWSFNVFRFAKCLDVRLTTGVGTAGTISDQRHTSRWRSRAENDQAVC